MIAQGAASGEFEAPDLRLASLCACTAMIRFFHPQMIAQCANKPGPTIDQMIDFVIAGLSPRDKVIETFTLDAAVRHCERSEAIHGALARCWIASSLRSSQ